MTAALLALAAALLVAPPRRRHGVARWQPQPVLQRSGKVSSAIGVAFAVACLAPATATVALLLLSGTVAWRRRAARRRIRRVSESEALQTALDMLVGELRAGAHPVVAFETTAGEVPEVVGSALRRVAASARLGADVADGLRAVAARASVPAHWTRLSVCWELANCHGLAIATLVRTAHRDVVERARFESGVEAGMAGARATALVLAGLPMLGMMLGELVGAEPVRFLLSGGLGGGLLLVGVAFACAGLLWSDHITTRTLT